MKDLDKLLDMICSAEYEYYDTYNRRKETLKVCYGNSDERRAIAGAINQWAMEQLTDVEVEKRIGELEAKVYAYEKIIANSNFAPMVQPIIIGEFKGFPKGEKEPE